MAFRGDLLPQPKGDSRRQRDQENQITILIGGGPLARWNALRRCFSKEAGFILVICSDAPDELFGLSPKLKPTVLIVDQQFIEGVDAAAFGRLVDFGRLSRVLVTVHTEDRETLEKLLRMGCSGFLGQRFSTATLRRAVRAVTAGELWVGRKAASQVLQRLLLEDRTKLTDREKEILRLIGLGYKNQEIATQLFISRETVRWHVKSIYHKIGVEDRLAAAMYARGERMQDPVAPESRISKRPPANHRPAAVSSALHTAG